MGKKSRRKKDQRGTVEADRPDLSRDKDTSIPARKIFAVSSAIFFIILILGVFQVNASRRPVLVGNELAHVKLTHAIVIDGVFDIDPRGSDASTYKGKYYSNKPPGYAFFIAGPYYIHAKLFGANRMEDAFLFAKYFNIALSSLAVVMIFLFLMTFRLSRYAVFFGLTAAVFGTIFPAYSCMANSMPFTFFLSIAAILLFRLSQIRKKAALFMAGSLFIAIYALIVDGANTFFLAPLIFWLSIKLLKDKRIIFFLFSCLPFLLLLYYNYRIFENPFVLPYSYYYPPSYVEFSDLKSTMSLSNVPRGFYGLLFGPARGLFLLSPVTVLGAFISWRALKERDLGLLCPVVIAFSGIFIMTAYVFWHGGHCVGYRHILLSAVILGMLSAFLIEKYVRARMAAVLLLAFSCFTGTASFFIQLDQQLLLLTWKAEPADIHANFYSELLYPFIKKKL
ncbi:hypothetical protein OAA99_03080 [Omnitrophica bacterium]|nr:hypothetical protein [Candidatus Omnitrophota bacterium]